VDARVDRPIVTHGKVKETATGRAGLLASSRKCVYNIPEQQGTLAIGRIVARTGRSRSAGPDASMHKERNRNQVRRKSGHQFS
jgi:hypothetical protein